MKIVFRVDASTVMGTGHVMRCRTLATALKKQGAEIQFVTRAHPGHLGDMLARDGFAVTLLPPPEIKTDDLTCKEVDYLAWLGVSQQQDALQCIRALENQPCNWLIVDHYGLDYIWEEQLQPHTHKLMVIDDLANRTHVCDVLLDQNYTLAGEERYRAKVPAPCQLLLGPRYALLRPEYAQYRETMVPRTGEIRRILVFMGGADNDNITGKVLSALSAVRLAQLEVDVVIGANFIHNSCVTAQATARPNTQIHGPRPHLADLMAKADLAIGAGGATTWERLCMGLPSLVVSIADNQIPACEALDRDGLILYLGNAFGLDVDLIESALIKIFIESVKLQDLATKSQTLVDGRGTNRVAETLLPTPPANLRLRPANAGDALTYFSWVNDPVVRSSANNPRPIDLGTHMHWFDKRLMDLNSYLYVFEAGDLPVGQVRFECHDAEATIDYSLDVLVRRRGWANQLLKMGIEALNSSRPMQLCAQVRAENLASAAIFIRLGFVEQITESREGGGGQAFSIVILSDQNSWLNDWLPEWIQSLLTAGHRVIWVHRLDALQAADFCFYLSYSKIVSRNIRSLFQNNLVVHESDLPQGKGWSPLTWQVLQGAQNIVVTLFEAADAVDAGVIYGQTDIQLCGDELVDDLRREQAAATFKLCNEFVAGYPGVLQKAREQRGSPSYFPRRTPENSRIDLDLPLRDQFNLLRVVDNQRYPAFFDLSGYRYDIQIRK